MAEERDGADTIAMAAGVAALKTTILAGLGGAIAGGLIATAIGGLALAPMLIGAAIGGAGLVAVAGAVGNRQQLADAPDAAAPPIPAKAAGMCSPCLSPAPARDAGTHFRDKVTQPSAAEQSK